MKRGDAMIKVEVVYALPERQWSLELEVADGATAQATAGLAMNSEPLLSVEDVKYVGFAVWGKEVDATYVLADGDRLELLRPLPVEPMETRRRKAAAQRRA